MGDGSNLPGVLAAAGLVGLLHQLRNCCAAPDPCPAKLAAQLQLRVEELQRAVAAKDAQLRNVHDDVTTCIGRTPLVRLPAERLGYPHCRATIWAKLEFQVVTSASVDFTVRGLLASQDFSPNCSSVAAVTVPRCC